MPTKHSARPRAQAAATHALLVCALAALTSAPAPAQAQSNRSSADAPTRSAAAKGVMDTVRLGARLQLDHGSFNGVYTDRGASASASYLRRGEVSIGFTPTPAWRASAVFAMEDDRLALDTAALSWRLRDGLWLSAGRIDPDFGLDNANSSSWTAGIERSALWDLAPGIADAEGGFGLKVDGHGPQWHASAGLHDKSGPTALVGRAVWLPMAAEARVLQLGASFARTQGLDDNGRLRTRLGVRGVTEAATGRRSELAPAARQPARYDADTVLGLELALQRGGWLLQAEALRRQLAGSATAPRRKASGRSLQLGWAPGGQARRHDAESARFGRPAGDGLALGRWELFYRFDALSGARALKAQVHTLGTNWFLAPHWRLSANAVSGRSDDANAVGERSGLGLVFRAQAVF